MSQYQLSDPSGTIAPNIEYIEGDVGGPVGPNPATFIIDLLGDPDQGLYVSGVPGSYKQTISDITVNEGTTTTNDATVTDVVTISLGIAGQYTVHIMISAYDGANEDGCSFVGYGSIKTDGAASTEVAAEEPLVEKKDTALNACDFNFIANVNTAVVQVKGVAGKTIAWRVWTKYVRT